MNNYSIFVWSKNYSKILENPIWKFPNNNSTLIFNGFSSSLNGEFLFIDKVIEVVQKYLNNYGFIICLIGKSVYG